MANTGGGGGGGSDSNTTSEKAGGNGGSGTVILRYPNSKTITVSAGLSGTSSADGNDTIYTFTSGTGTVSWS